MWFSMTWMSLGAWENLCKKHCRWTSKKANRIAKTYEDLRVIYLPAINPLDKLLPYQRKFTLSDLFCSGRVDQICTYIFTNGQACLLLLWNIVSYQRNLFLFHTIKVASILGQFLAAEHIYCTFPCYMRRKLGMHTDILHLA